MKALKKPKLYGLAMLMLLSSLCLPGLAQQHSRLSRPSVRPDFSEADAIVKILIKEKNKEAVTDDDWSDLFATIPFKKLQQRELSYHNTLTEDQFKQFLGSAAMIGQADMLSKTVSEWKKADFNTIAEKIRAYLPSHAVLNANIYPVIKPSKNSFIWGEGPDKAIFLFVNPLLTKDQFANKVAHESHHIGMSSLENEQHQLVAGLSKEKKAAFDWLGGFGEGAAMLAAAGSPNVHPHFFDDQAAQKVWDESMRDAGKNIDTLQRFFRAILTGKLKNDEQIQKAAEPFWGTQGAWYTVGYEMCRLVELHFGRRQLLAALLDPRKLLALYNKAAGSENRRNHTNLALWPKDLIKGLY